MDSVRTVLSLPVPKVLGWSSNASETPVGSEYILTEYVEGAAFGEVSSKLSEQKVDACMRESMDIISRLSGTHFGRIGSIFYTEDVSEELRSIPLFADEGLANGRPGAERFRIGPSVSDLFWKGRRAQLSVDRGPCEFIATDSSVKTSPLNVYINREGSGILRNSGCEVSAGVAQDHPT